MHMGTRLVLYRHERVKLFSTCAAACPGRMNMDAELGKGCAIYAGTACACLCVLCALCVSMRWLLRHRRLRLGVSQATPTIASAPLLSTQCAQSGAQRAQKSFFIAACGMVRLHRSPCRSHPGRCGWYDRRRDSLGVVCQSESTLPATNQRQARKCNRQPPIVLFAGNQHGTCGMRMIEDDLDLLPPGHQMPWHHASDVCTRHRVETVN
jgi:hypothetical protein